MVYHFCMDSPAPSISPPQATSRDWPTHHRCCFHSHCCWSSPASASSSPLYLSTSGLPTYTKAPPPQSPHSFPPLRKSQASPCSPAYYTPGRPTVPHTNTSV